MKYRLKNITNVNISCETGKIYIYANLHYTHKYKKVGKKMPLSFSFKNNYCGAKMYLECMQD